MFIQSRVRYRESRQFYLNTAGSGEFIGENRNRPELLWTGPSTSCQWLLCDIAPCVLCLQVGIITTKNKRAEKLTDLAGEGHTPPLSVTPSRDHKRIRHVATDSLSFESLQLSAPAPCRLASHRVASNFMGLLQFTACFRVLSLFYHFDN